MKKALALILSLCFLCPALASCTEGPFPPEKSPTETLGSALLGGDSTSFGKSLEELAAYDGYFEEALSELEILCEEGTKNAYRLEGNTLTFTALSEDSVYSVSGRLRGNLVIDVGEAHRLDLEFKNFSLVSPTQCPVVILSGDRVSLTAKKDTKNYIYDLRAAEEEGETLSGAVHSEVDLEICA